MGIENTSIRQEEGVCVNDPVDASSISFDESEDLIELNGDFAVERTNTDLLISAQNSVGYEDRPKDEVLIHIDPIVNENREGEPCSAIIEYIAHVSVDGHPSAIEVYHVGRERRGEVIERRDLE